jgi:hypothetical protein
MLCAKHAMMTANDKHTTALAILTEVNHAINIQK